MTAICPDSRFPPSNAPPDIFQFVDAVQGRTTASLQRLHQKYGSVVQLGPATVSIADPGMIAAVYGIRSNLPKVTISAGQIKGIS